MIQLTYSTGTGFKMFLLHQLTSIKCDTIKQSENVLLLYSHF